MFLRLLSTTIAFLRFFGEIAFVAPFLVPFVPVAFFAGFAEVFFDGFFGETPFPSFAPVCSAFFLRLVADFFGAAFFPNFETGFFPFFSGFSSGSTSLPGVLQRHFGSLLFVSLSCYYVPFCSGRSFLQN